MLVTGVDYTLPDPHALIDTPDGKKLISVHDIESLVQDAPKEYRCSLKAFYRLGFLAAENSHQKSHHTPHQAP